MLYLKLRKEGLLSSNGLFVICLDAASALVEPKWGGRVTNSKILRESLDRMSIIGRGFLTSLLHEDPQKESGLNRLTYTHKFTLSPVMCLQQLSVLY